MTSRGYWLTTYRSISDPAAHRVYAELAGPALVAAGGRFLVRGLPTHLYEHASLERVVIIEFPSVEAARAAYESAAYSAALKVLGDSADREVRIFAGATETP